MIVFSKAIGEPLHKINTEAAKTIMGAILNSSITFCYEAGKECTFCVSDTCCHSILSGDGICGMDKESKEVEPEQLSLF